MEWGWLVRVLAAVAVLAWIFETSDGFTGRPSLIRAFHAPACTPRGRRATVGWVEMGRGDGEGVALGTVTLVGAGPGDPELLTVAAARLLDREDCLVIADRLVSKQILGMVKGKLKIAQKLPGCAEAAQQQIYQWAEEALRDGQDVVRLKIGDPFVFGRGSEEVLEFRRRLGIETQVLPGVSAAFSSPLLGGVPVTHREAANQVIMSTGFGKNYSVPALQNYHEDQTAIFLMAVGRLEELSNRLVRDAGYPEDCPAAVIEKASCPDQRTLLGTISNIAELAREHRIQPPSTVVFGRVVEVLHGAHQGLVQPDVVSGEEETGSHDDLHEGEGSSRASGHVSGSSTSPSSIANVWDPPLPLATDPTAEQSRQANLTRHS